MGQTDQDELTVAQILYPCMQCADIFFLQVEGPRSPEEMLSALSRVVEESASVLVAERIQAEERRNNIRFCWRLSLGLAGFPTGLLTLGVLLVVETPNSLVERGLLEEGKVVLRRIRGTDNVEPEFLELVEAIRIAEEVKHPFRNLLKRR